MSDENEKNQPQMDGALNKIEEMAREMISQFVAHPEALEIKARSLGVLVMVRIRAHASDTPRIIGQQGRHVAAIQTIMKRIGSQLDLRVRVEVLESVVGERERIKPYSSNPEWKPEGVLRTLGMLCFATTSKLARISAEQADGTTVFHIKEESAQELISDKELILAVETILHAIGRAQGQRIYIDSASRFEDSSI